MIPQNQVPIEASVSTHRLTTPALMSMTLIVTDLCALTAAVLLGYRIWVLVNPKIPSFDAAMLIAPVATLIAFIFSDLYPGIGLTTAVGLRRLWRSITLSYLLLTAAMFSTRTWWSDSRGGFYLSFLLSLLLVPCGRWICEQVLTTKSLWGVPVLVIGAGEAARSVIRNLKANRSLGYCPVACVDEDSLAFGDVEGVPIAGTLDEIALLASAYCTQYAIVAMPGMSRESLVWHLREWSKVFPKILIVPDLSGIASLWTEPRDLGGLLALEMQQKLLDKKNQRIKRAADIILSASGLIVAAPFIALSAIWIRKVSAGLAIYTQNREGKNGRNIKILKLRTMHANSEEMLSRHLAENTQARHEWARYCKLKNDPRILPGIGKFLRRTSLDELPQLWNVLVGEMSLVGPRPFPAYHNQLFDDHIRTLRVQVTPGLTGLWQVGARSDGDLDVQASLDTYYILNWSLWLDLYILIRTARAVLTREGSY